MGFSPRKTVREFASVEERYGAEVCVGFAPAITFLCAGRHREEVRPRSATDAPGVGLSQHRVVEGLAWPPFGPKARGRRRFPAAYGRDGQGGTAGKRVYRQKIA